MSLGELDGNAFINLASAVTKPLLSYSRSYFFSCLSSSFLTHHLGLRYTLHLAALSLSSGCLLLSFAPPFGAFIAAVAMMGFGGGLYDAAITTVISHEEDGALMSYLYSFFGGESNSERRGAKRTC